MLETEIILSKVNITSNYRGYKIIVAAVDIALEDETAFDAIMDKIYSVLAERFALSCVSVERNISTAITAAWRVAGYRFNKELGYKGETQPQSAEFLKMVTTQVKKMLEN